jgi:hypothetical protein
MTVPYWGLTLYSEDALSILALNGEGTLLPDMPFLYYLNFGVYCASYLGLLFRNSWAKYSLLGIVCLGLCLAPFNGALVLIGIDVAIYNGLTLLSGLLIGLAFFSQEAWRNFVTELGQQGS